MINFEDELKKFHPSLEIEDVADAIYNQDLTDMADIMVSMLKNNTKQQQYSQQQYAQFTQYGQEES